MSRRTSVGARWCSGAVLAVAVFAGHRSFAQTISERQPGPAVVSSHEPSASSVAASTLPFTMTPQGLTYGAASTGFDGARGVVTYGLYADAKVYRGFSVRAGYASPDLSGHGSALFGARFQLLQQSSHGVDLGASLFYMPQNIYEEGLVVGRLSVGRRLGRVQLLAHGAYGQDPEGDDLQAEAAAATLVQMTDACFIGFDARARSLIATTDAKHAGFREPVLDLLAGPVATYRLGLFALIAQGGVSALWLDRRAGTAAPSASTVGAFGLLGASLHL